MSTNTSNINKLQEQADDVKETMLANVNKIKDRGGKLEVLDDRAEQLFEAGKVFEKTTKEVAQQEKCKNMKWKIILGVTVALVILAIIIIIVIYNTPPPNSADSASRSTTLEGTQKPT
ncbi:vesicle-associated membrane protein 5 [Heterodontus francisci]|uniref:vesicle-associated membrane protein 5 n=1 Tax=Heterodontus francisci TaxID=7792 RepID=UPI00355C0A79